MNDLFAESEDGAGSGGARRVSVWVPAPIEGALDYVVPVGMNVTAGDLVEIALGSRPMLGVVVGEGADGISEDRLKPVRKRLNVPGLTEPHMQFLSRAADYTLTPPGMMARLATRAPDLEKSPRGRLAYRLGDGHVMRMTPARQAVLDTLAGVDEAMDASRLRNETGASPAVLKGLAEAGAIVAERIVQERPYPPLFGQAPGRHLSADQEAAAAHLRTAIGEHAFRAILLRGVTGSGKTEVYLEAVAACIGQGRQALVLLPEVALTPAFLDRVKRRFGAEPATWHHGVAAAERRRLWLAAAAGRVSLVVGARSALFLPFRDLGLIIIDEEHEQSYKQEDVVSYHARDMGVLRAQIHGAVAVLASATPSLETWANADAGKYERLDLPDRFGRAVMPEIRMIDLRTEMLAHDAWISETLAAAVKDRLAKGEQALLFLNRRGYAPLTLCRACGHRFGCPDCDACLVTHRLRARLMCHQCGHVEPLPTSCPACGRSDRLAECGPGIERVAEEAAARFPGARIELLSSDLVPSAADMKARLAAIAAGGADIIIGTQIVAKGHNFPGLTLVGVIDGDLGLQGGDLRAAERTFQLISQVAGRAGRADKRGDALIQTANPDHPVMRALVSGEAEAFWVAEAEARHAAGAPPYGRMAGVVVSGLDEARVWEVANVLGRGRAVLDRAGAELFGPAPAPIARIRGRMRVRLLVKAPKGIALQPALRAWRAGVKIPASVRVSIDIDPQSFL
ncbi:MAG: primosomal protein N' [Pseudomonadota bacterium]